LRHSFRPYSTRRASALDFNLFYLYFFSFQLYFNPRRRFRGDYFSPPNKNAKKRAQNEQIFKVFLRTFCGVASQAGNFLFSRLRSNAAKNV